MKQEKIMKLVRETSELRKDLIETGIEDGSLTVELSNRDLAAIVYALSSAWISEYISGAEGYREILNMLGDASATILVADSSSEIEEGLNDLLGGKDAA